MGVESPVVLAGKEVGTICASEGNVGVGVVQFDSVALNEKPQFCSAIASLGDSEILIGNERIRCIVPPYCNS